MFWPDDNEWYTADVVGYDAEARQHRLWYHIDEQYESIDMAEEEKGGRVQWLPMVDISLWPPPPVRQPPPGTEPKAAEPGAAAAALPVAASLAPLSTTLSAQVLSLVTHLTTMHRMSTSPISPDQQHKQVLAYPLSGDHKPVPLYSIRLEARCQTYLPRFHRFPRARPQALLSSTSLQQLISAHIQRQSPPVLASSSAPRQPIPVAVASPNVASPMQRPTPLMQSPGLQPGHSATTLSVVASPPSSPPCAPAMLPTTLSAVASTTDLRPTCSAPPAAALPPTLSAPSLAAAPTAPSAPDSADRPPAGVSASPRLQIPPPPDNPPQGPAAAAAAAAGYAASPAAAAAPAVPRPAVPATVNVITGSLTGVFNVARLDVTLADGNTVSATEFERLAGRGSSKKWKVGFVFLNF